MTMANLAGEKKYLRKIHAGMSSYVNTGLESRIIVLHVRHLNQAENLHRVFLCMVLI